MNDEIDRLRDECRRLFDAHLAVIQAYDRVGAYEEAWDYMTAMDEMRTISLQAIQATSKAGIFKNQG